MQGWKRLTIYNKCVEMAIDEEYKIIKK